jgi:hypothetical protein
MTKSIAELQAELNKAQAEIDAENAKVFHNQQEAERIERQKQALAKQKREDEITLWRLEEYQKELGLSELNSETLIPVLITMIHALRQNFDTRELRFTLEAIYRLKNQK